MKEGTAAIHAFTVREFLHIITAQAKAALADMDRPGFLQISQLHPASEKLIPSRYTIDDVERMVADAIGFSQNGCNVYIEGRTIREDAPSGGARGKLEDSRGVFALTVDSDADKQMGWSPTARPSMTVETSPGNFQFWFFLREAISAAVAQKLGERIRQAVNSDHDTGNPVQPYRIAGTVNYPSAKKIARGRVTVPTQLIEFDPESLWTPEEIELAFPLPERKTNGNGTQTSDGTTDASGIPADSMDAIRNGGRMGDDRSQVFWNVMVALKRLGWTVDGIVALLEKYPDGIAKKYRGRLRQEVERDYNKIKSDNAAAQPNNDGPLFDPWEHYIVPSFPFDVLPPIAQDYVAAQSSVIGCDPSALAMTVMATFSGALHHGFALKMMRNGAWYERPRLWVLLVADPSQLKTPIINAATTPLAHYETHLRVKYETDLRDYELILAQTGEDDPKPRKPDPPPRYIVWDTTVEKLGELLARSDKGLLVKSDEISGWLGNMERYNAGRSDRGFWLCAYDGGPHSIDRIKRGEMFIKNLSVSLLGGIQPARLAEIQGLTSDGMLQRFVPTMMGSASLPQDCPSDDEKYHALVRDMIFAKPARLIMTDGALAIMSDLRQHLFNLEQASGGLASGFQSFIGKLRGVAGSLALILHMSHNPYDGAADPVDEGTIESVRRLVLDFIVPHAFEFYRAGETDGERLRRLASWVLTANKTRIVASDLTTNVADFRGLTVMQVNERVSPLVAAGWLQAADLTPVCRSWTVLPQVLVQFAERAKLEEERKATVRALWAQKKLSGKTT